MECIYSYSKRNATPAAYYNHNKQCYPKFVTQQKIIQNYYTCTVQYMCTEIMFHNSTLLICIILLY